MESVTFGNGASVHYEYDAANRLTAIEHRDDAPEVFLRLEYAWTEHDLPESITESDGTATTAVVEFVYDARKRLRRETRSMGDAYDLAYTYDNRGNRTVKTNVGNALRTEYVYDLSNPSAYGNRNNRLMFSETFDTSGKTEVLLSRTWYYYSEAGNVTRVVTKEEQSRAGQQADGNPLPHGRSSDRRTIRSTMILAAREIR